MCGLGLGASTAFLLGPKAKADPNEASNTEALTPLHAAAMAGSLECVELLLSNGARAVTWHGWWALHVWHGLLASSVAWIVGMACG